MAVIAETTYRLACDECGYWWPETDERSKVREAADDDIRQRHLIEGRDVCHECTEEGKAEARELMIKLAINAWRYDGVPEDRAREIAGAMLDQGILPPPETPLPALQARVHPGVIEVVFRECVECRAAVACLLGGEAPASCAEHN